MMKERRMKEIFEGRKSETMIELKKSRKYKQMIITIRISIPMAPITIQR